MKTDKKFKCFVDNMNVVEIAKAIRYNENLIRQNTPRKYSHILAELIFFIPMSENKEAMFFKLPAKSKKGFLSRYIMKCAKEIGLPDIYIKNFNDYKNRLKRIYNQNLPVNYKKDEILKRKDKLLSETVIILIATLQMVKSKSNRQKKLEDIFLKD